MSFGFIGLLCLNTPISTIFATSGGIETDGKSSGFSTAQDVIMNVTDMWGNNSVTVIGNPSNTTIMEGKYRVIVNWNGTIEWEYAYFNIFLRFEVGNYTEDKYDYRFHFNAEIQHNVSFDYIFGVSFYMISNITNNPEIRGTASSNTYNLVITVRDDPSYCVARYGVISAELIILFPLAQGYHTEFFVSYAYMEVISQ